MNQYLSDKIKILSFYAIILVLYIHSNFHNYPHEILGMEMNHILQNTISVIIGQCAVPLFYMISGYLFFLNAKNIKNIIEKIKKRIRTLLIPFIIACLFFPLFYILLEIIPGTDKFINSQNNFSNNFQQPITNILLSLFYKTPGGTSPWAFQLWFLRDLIIIIIISPLLFYIREKTKKEFIIIGLFFLHFTKINIFPFTACFWFMFGDSYLPQLNRLKIQWILPLFICSSIIEVFFSNNFPFFLSIPIKIIGIACFWNIYDIIVPPTFKLADHTSLRLLTGYTFFIYLYHEPSLNIVRKIIVIICGQTSSGFAISYLLSPWIFAICATFIGFILKKRFSYIYSIIVGGR